jgi:hypothetical protein
VSAGLTLSTAELYSRATEGAIRRLARAFPRLDEQQLHDAVADEASAMFVGGDFRGLCSAAWKNARDIVGGSSCSA